MDTPQIPDEITFDDFMKVGMYVGTVLSATLNEKARKPAYVLEVYFGEQIGKKTTSAQITQHYTPNTLVGKQVVAVLNFPSKRVAGVKSEVLVLGAVNDTDGVVLIQPSQPIANGSRIG